MMNNEFDNEMLRNLTQQITSRNNIITKLQEANERLKKELHESKQDVNDISKTLPLEAIKRCPDCSRFRFNKSECEHCGNTTLLS